MDNINKNKAQTSLFWWKYFKDKWGLNIPLQDIHKVFNNIGFQQYEVTTPSRKPTEPKVMGYKYSDLEGHILKGGLQKALAPYHSQGYNPYAKPQEPSEEQKKRIEQSKMFSKGKKRVNTTQSKPSSLFYREEPPKPQEYVSKLDIQPEYKNGENDMEKYSDYLIQQYQWEGKQYKTIIITEEQFNRLFQ
jgi:hypothetical protein